MIKTFAFSLNSQDDLEEIARRFAQRFQLQSISLSHNVKIFMLALGGELGLDARRKLLSTLSILPLCTISILFGMPVALHSNEMEI